MNSERAWGGSSAPSLTDGAVLLNGFTLLDIEEHLAGEDEEQARRFGWYPKRSTEETVRGAILRWMEGWRAGRGRLAWAAREVHSGRMVGGCEIRLYDAGTPEMSWWIFLDYRRRGLATRIIRLACDFAFRELGVTRMAAQIAPDNVGSRRAAENAGFVLQVTPSPGDPSPPQSQDLVLYARDADGE